LAADVVIVNTCSVTAEADRAARAFIRRAHRRNPAAKIVVTGCYAQRAPEELAAMAGVAAVVGNSHKALAPEIILNLTRESELDAAERRLAASEPATTGAGGVIARGERAAIFGRRGAGSRLDPNLGPHLGPHLGRRPLRALLY
jgi:tRNA A37 methylthiotransferase MiaB